MLRPSKKIFFLIPFVVFLNVLYIHYFKQLSVSIVEPAQQVPLQVFGLGTWPVHYRN